jgi:hypothetical protein
MSAGVVFGQTLPENGNLERGTGPLLRNLLVWINMHKSHQILTALVIRQDPPSRVYKLRWWRLRFCWLRTSH